MNTKYPASKTFQEISLNLTADKSFIGQLRIGDIDNAALTDQVATDAISEVGAILVEKQTVSAKLALEGKMKLHKYCAVLPKMVDDEFQALKADIKEHGLLEPIVIYEDAILDGRHRQLICEELEIKPDYIQFEVLGYNGSALDYVISKHQRRNLTSDQKAILADKVANLKDGERQVLTNEKVTLSEALKSTGASKGQVGKLRKIKKINPEIIERIESGETSINAEYQKTLAKQRNTANSEEELNQHNQAGRNAGTIPEQEQQRFNASIELKQQNEDIKADCKNTLRSALVQIVSSIETLKDAVAAIGIKETLVILASADDVCGLNNPLLLLANIRNDVDNFLTHSKAIKNDSKARSFQEIVRQQFRIQASHANQLIQKACSGLDIERGKRYTIEEKELMLGWMTTNHDLFEEFK